MEKFTIHCGLVVPLDRENVDTDAIIPKQFLKSIKRIDNAIAWENEGTPRAQALAEYQASLNSELDSSN